MAEDGRSFYQFSALLAILTWWRAGSPLLGAWLR
jgi:hypothetical protein